jgi:hypothetical protein
MSKLTPQEVATRENFVLSRVRAGLSRKQIALQICEQFGVGSTAADDVYNTVIDGLAERSPNDLRRNRAIILEMLHSQVSSYQADLVAVQTQIKISLDIQEQRALIAEQLSIPTLSKDRKAALRNELKSLHSIRPNVITGMVETKARVRTQLVRAVAEIARVHGLYNEMPLLQAISVLATSELLPPTVANQMLDAIEGISDSIERAVQSESKPLDVLEEDLN